MALRLNDEFLPPAGQPEDPEQEMVRLKAVLEQGALPEQHVALARLVELNAETALVECLRSENPLTVSLATSGLWECWLNEEGPVARRELEKGIGQMEAGELEDAVTLFGRLIKKYPQWAEAYNKQATALFLLGNPRLSLKLCQQVVELKPLHFGAWNGMALCAAKLEKWRIALEAARKALAIQPSAHTNLDIIQLAETRIAEGEC